MGPLISSKLFQGLMCLFWFKSKVFPLSLALNKALQGMLTAKHQIPAFPITYVLEPGLITMITFLVLL